MSTLSVPIPDEPPVHSVVLGADGRAWQSFQRTSGTTAWWAAGKLIPLFGTVDHEKTWPHLLTDEGPLTLLVQAPEVAGTSLDGPKS